MIENREDENLRCMYNFLNRVDDGLKPMIKYLNSFVTESGKLIVQGTNIKAADFIKVTYKNCYKEQASVMSITLTITVLIYYHFTESMFFINISPNICIFRV